MAKWTLTLFLCSWQLFPSITWKDWIIIRWLHVTEAVLIFITRLIETVGKTTFFGTRQFLVSVLAKLDALKYGQWVPRLIKQCRIGLYMWCCFFNVVHITLYSTVLKRVTLQAKWVQSRTGVMKIDIMNQIAQRSEYHCAVNTADGKAKDLGGCLFWAPGLNDSIYLIIQRDKNSEDWKTNNEYAKREE